MKIFVQIPVIGVASVIIAVMMVLHVVFGMAQIALVTLSNFFHVISEICINGVVDSVKFVDENFLRGEK